MRTLKFRTWSKQAQCIIPWEELKPKFVKLLDNPEYPYMQFTGLLDKSGVEIYEGDIVKWQHSLKGGIVAIIFKDGCFCVAGFYIDASWNKPPEVIGNIYKNPELIKGEIR